MPCSVTRCVWSAGLSLARKLISIAEWIKPVSEVLLRLAIAGVFFRSGLTKISAWDNTITLFTYEYSVPLLSPEIAATISTVFELGCPILITLGLATRLATLPLLSMTAVIEFTYQHGIEHQLWAAILFFLACSGPGKLSLDHLIRCKLLQSSACQSTNK